MYNYINDENIKLKTKILQLEKCIEQPKQQENMNSVNAKPTHLIESLKQSIRDLKTEIKAKDKEIEDMKRYVRYTKMQELEGENMQYSNECMRLKRIIDELLEEKGIIPGGLNAYEKLKLENEEFRKSISNLKESN
jgi:predicted RNase H-like nuclease (RuvC/YqgF family)